MGDYASHALRQIATFLKVGGRGQSVSEPQLLLQAKIYGLSAESAKEIIDDVFKDRLTNRAEELMAAEDLGRRIAEALEPLGLSPEAVQAAAAYAAAEGRGLETVSRSRFDVRRYLARDQPGIAERYARAAGVAAYFEEKSKA